MELHFNGALMKEKLNFPKCGICRQRALQRCPQLAGVIRSGYHRERQEQLKVDPAVPVMKRCAFDVRRFRTAPHQLGEAAQSLVRFRARYPDYRLPDDLQ